MSYQKTFQTLLELDWDGKLKDSDAKKWIISIVKDAIIQELSSVCGVVQFWAVLPSDDLVTISISVASESRNRIDYTRRIRLTELQSKESNRDFDCLGSRSVGFGQRCNKAILASLRE